MKLDETTILKYINEEQDLDDDEKENNYLVEHQFYSEKREGMEI
jgi:hypothetical protein